MADRYVSAMLQKLASDSIGIYPASWQDGDTIIKRTEWQDGWNAACIEKTNRWCKFEHWLRSLPPDVGDAFKRLLACDMLRMDVHEGEVEVYLESDTADVEIFISQIVVVASAWDAGGKAGVESWVQSQRCRVDVM